MMKSKLNKMSNLSARYLLIGLFLLCSGLLFAQVPASNVRMMPKVIGKILDVKGDGIPGATIRLKNNQGIGTSTNLEGEFSLTLPEETAVLVVSYIGMKSKEIVVNEKSGHSFIITLEEDEAVIQDVVITGYYTRPKEGFTGNASTFTTDDLKSISNKNLLSSLQTLDPSFVIAENLSLGSNPNSLPDIQIRGTSGLSDLKGDYNGNPNEPLFILDGFETTLQKVFDLDMNRVSSITLLKDAAAKAIYGSKAANGVVIIETVAPREGELRVTYTGSMDIEAPDLSSYHLANAREKLQVEKNAGRFTSSHPFTQQFLNEQYNLLLANVQAGIDTYWLSQPLRTGIGQKHSIYIEGGSNAMRYGADVSYNKVEGVMKQSNRENIAGSINLSYRQGNVVFRNILSVNFNKATNSPYGNFADYVNMNPYYSPTDENGNMQKLLGTYAASSSSSTTPTYYYNPLYNATIGTKDFSKYTEVTENFYIEWQALENLKLTGRIGFSQVTNASEHFLPGDHTAFAQWTGDSYYKRGSYTMTDGVNTSLSSDITVNWSKQFGKNLIFANAAWNLSTRNMENHGFTAWGFLNNRVDFVSFARQYQENGVPSGSESITREVGVLGAVNYSYDNRYLADVTFRTNASSVYGTDSRWGNFWSAGIGWNMHHEPFVKNNPDLKFLKQFKIRGSVGSTGSQNFSPYQAMATYTFLNKNQYTSSTYDNIAGANLYALANDNLSWQRTLDINVGTDIQLMDRLTVKFDYYISNTQDLLIDFTLPPSTGFSYFKENLGELQNKGFDGTINWQFFRSPAKQAYGSVFASVGHNKNKIRKISDALKKSNEEQDTQTDNLTSPLTRYEEGQSVNAIWAVQSLGIDPVTGQEIFVTKDGNTTYSWNANDQIVAGDASPKLRGTFGFNGEYKGWGINCYFSYRLGEDYYNSTLVNRVENVDIANNVDYRVFSSTWQNPGDEALFKKITANPTTTRPTTRFVERKNELTLTSINVYYDFKWLNLSKYKLERLKCTFYMNDLFVLSTVRTERGTTYPFARNFSLSLQATF